MAILGVFISADSQSCRPFRPRFATKANSKPVPKMIPSNERHYSQLSSTLIVCLRISVGVGKPKVAK